MSMRLPPPIRDARHISRRTFSLLAAGIAAALVPALAGAQQSSPGTTELDRVAVTGSRIRRVDVETAQPVLTLSREDIQAQGFGSVADILQNVSAATGAPPFSRASPLTSNQEAGGQYIDLRNIGAQRTLVLVNGKRLGISPGGYQDLSTIPMVMVERVEVLKDGASSIYGSDAIAGVINIITRKNFEGAEFNYYRGEYSQGDGQKETADFMVGFTGERGSITVGAEYHKEEGVWARDRWFTEVAYPGIAPELSQTTVGQWGHWRVGNAGPWQVADRGSNALGPGQWHNQTAEDTSRATDQMHLLTPLERRSLYVNANYDLNQNVRFVSDLGYTKRDSFSQIAGYPMQSQAFGTPMSADSYFNPTGGQSPVNWRRRGWENPRTTDTELATWRFTAALEGAFEIGSRYFNWDVGGLFNQNDIVITGNGNFYIPAVANAVGPSFMNAQGQIVCGTPGNEIAGCVPWNPFAGFGTGAEEHSLDDPRVRNYLYREEHATGQTTTHSYFANLSGSILTLPAGDLGFAVGYEYRKEEGHFNPDAIAQSGNSTNLASGPTGGAYQLDEFYLELNVPILANMPGAKELTVDLASRYSDFDTFGDTTNNKVGLKWRPMDDLLVRGTWAEGFRAPTIANLYGGGSETFSFFSDPCDTVYGIAAGNARCLQDVPPGFRQLEQGFVPTVGASRQTPVPFRSGSNPNLGPETSRSKTLGFVYSPSYVNGLSIGMDWWHIRIDNTVVPDSANAILRDCYLNGIESRCNAFTRDPSQGNIVTNLRYGTRNAGYYEVEGVDIDLSYALDTAVGRWSAKWATTYTSQFEVKSDNEPDTIPEQRNGIDDYFRIRSNLSLGWALNNVSVNWGMRYYSGTKEACHWNDLAGDGFTICNLPDYTPANARGQKDPMNKAGSVTFHDLQLAYKTPWNGRISIGANNVFGRIGPAKYEQPSSNYSYYGGWDIGRFLYVRYNQRF